MLNLPSLPWTPTALPPHASSPKDHQEGRLVRLHRRPAQSPAGCSTSGEGLRSHDIHFIQVVLSEVLFVPKRVPTGQPPRGIGGIDSQAPLAFGGRAVHSVEVVQAHTGSVLDTEAGEGVG